MPKVSDRSKRNSLLACCGAHAIQDGLVALQYVLLPVLAVQFNLNYSQVGFLRAIGHTAMTVLEIPAGILAEKWGERKLLAFGLVCAGAGYLGIAQSSSFFWIAVCLLVAGVGAGFQHSLSSAIIVRVFGEDGKRQSLGNYNASGDGGKLAFTGIFSFGMGIGVAWDFIVMLLVATSVILGLFVLKLVQKNQKSRSEPDEDAYPDSDTPANNSWGIKRPRQFRTLAMVVFLDSLVQAVFLTFLGFIMLQKGASATQASLAVVVALVGGMAGKFVAGGFAQRFGDRTTFRVMQFLAILGLCLLIYLPVSALWVALPLIGVVIQGTSTVTYGSVSGFLQVDKQSRGYALIYSFSSISSVVGPFILGMLADFTDLYAVIWVLIGVTFVSILLSHVLGRNSHKT